jgi:hypothetical protein
MAEPEHSRCAWCGRPARTVHHKIPVHVDPSLEMVRSNWQPTCGDDGPCHFHLAHRGDWRAFEGEPDAEAARNLARIKARRYTR